MKQVGTWTVNGDQFVLELGPVDWTHSVYVWRDAEGNVVRVGSTQGKLRKRLLGHRSDITRALNGLKSPTPTWEAEVWRDAGQGTVHARSDRYYRAREEFLLEKHRPPANAEIWSTKRKAFTV